MEKEKLPIEFIKLLPPSSLVRLIERAKSYLKDDSVMLEVCSKYDLDPDFIDLIPIKFGDLDVSAKTSKGVIILNYKLLCDGDFFKDYSYLIHEITHFLDQCFGEKPTTGSNNSSDYLDNPFEQEAFQNQVKYISNHFGEEEAEEYVDKLLNHHEIENEEKDDKKEVLMSKL
jgi:hypothetical protein